MNAMKGQTPEQSRPCAAFLRKTIKPAHPQYNAVSQEWYVDCVSAHGHSGMHSSARGDRWLTTEGVVIDRRG
jgi:hypothetical protein